MPRLRLAFLIGLPLLAAACGTRDPLAALGPADRAALAAGERRGDPAAVNALLSRARQAPAAAPRPQVEPLVLRFAGTETRPSAEQRLRIEAFAQRAAGAGRLLVVAQRPERLTGAEALLGQRRAVAVALLLAPRFPDIETRFDPAAPAGEVVVLPERSLAP